VAKADFFLRLGTFISKNYFDSETCLALRREARSAGYSPSWISRKGAYLIDEDTRNTKTISMSKETLRRVHEQLLQLKPMLEEHFGIALKKCEDPQFLLYKEGDFFKPHKDVIDSDATPEAYKERKISIVSFLNSQATHQGDDTYSGGELNLFGLFKGQGSDSIGIPLEGEEGLVLAFRSDLVHEVTPVTAGERFTVVTWFH
jgi:predicted 2-oxoglutarate/Fe(II)-dependent dioxygenase YbiX